MSSVAEIQHKLMTTLFIGTPQEFAAIKDGSTARAMFASIATGGIVDAREVLHLKGEVVSLKEANLTLMHRLEMAERQIARLKTIEKAANTYAEIIKGFQPLIVKG